MTPNPITNTSAITRFRIMKAVMFGCEASTQLVGERLKEKYSYLDFTLKMSTYYVVDISKNSHCHING